MALLNEVTNADGVLIATFLCSSDAHEFAQRETTTYCRGLRVTDFSGTVVHYVYGKAPIVEKRGDRLVEHGMWEPIERNLRDWIPGIVIPALEAEA